MAFQKISENLEQISDPTSERQVLGSMMVEKSVIPSVGRLLGPEPDAFLSIDHGLIYQAILSVYERSGTADAVMVANELRATGQLNRAGGIEYLYELQAAIAETTNTEHHAKLLYEKMTRRRLIHAASQIRELAYDGETHIGETLNQVQEKIIDITQSESERVSVPIAPLVIETIDSIEEMCDKNEQYSGIPTGFPELDEMISGLQPGYFYIIAARPSVGKTSLVLDIARHIGIETNLPVGIFSLEMPGQDLTMRMLSAESGINLTRLRNGRLRDEDFARLNAAGDKLKATRLFINDDSGLTLPNLRAEARRLKSEQRDLALIIVDYLQLVRGGSTRYEMRQQEIAEISRSLKILSAELKVPVLACSQLNRLVERRPGKEPELSDIRESGAIEQDADFVAFLHREDLDTSDTLADERVLTDLMIKKQRNGPTGTVPLYFNRSRSCFEGR